MKRAFDANVSRARPRTRTRTAVVDGEPEAPLSADLAAALVGPRVRERAGEARRAGAVAEAAGAVAAAVAMSREAEQPKRRDPLARTEEGLALRAGEAALATAREAKADRKGGLARALHQAAERVAEAAADAARRQSRPPEWVMRAAVPVEAADILAEELLATDVRTEERAAAPATAAGVATEVSSPAPASGGDGRQRHEAAPAAARLAAATDGQRTHSGEAPAPVATQAAPAPVAASGSEAARPRTPAGGDAAAREAPAVAAPATRLPAASARSHRIEEARMVAGEGARARQLSLSDLAARTPKAEAPSADLAATMRDDLLAAAPRSRTRLEREEPRLQEERLSADLARTLANAHGLRPRLAAPGEETVAEGRARIAELRGRLAAAAAKPRLATEEIAPEHATAAVRQAVEELRRRLHQAVLERDGLARALEATRDELAAAQRELARRERELEEAQRLAAERALVAEELAAEAEALAEERDQALARILELKSLDEQQTKLLAEAERALADRDALLERAESELAEMAGLLDARAAEIEELAALLEERTRERDDLARTVERLEAEIARLAGTREALAEIQRLVAVAPGR